jgi:hypothetical protein
LIVDSLTAPLALKPPQKHPCSRHPKFSGQLRHAQDRRFPTTHGTVLRHGVQRALTLQPGVPDRHGDVLLAVDHIGDGKALGMSFSRGLPHSTLPSQSSKARKISIRGCKITSPQRSRARQTTAGHGCQYPRQTSAYSDPGLRSQRSYR